MADNTLDLMDDDTVSISECARKKSIDYILIVVVLGNGVMSQKCTSISLHMLDCFLICLSFSPIVVVVIIIIIDGKDGISSNTSAHVSSIAKRMNR